MPSHFVRVEFSPQSPFNRTRLGPGTQLLDEGGANFNILRRWLGSLAAESVATATDARFFVHRNNVRLLDVVCQPASPADLAGFLAAQVKELRDKLAGAAAQPGSEQTLKTVLLAQLQAALGNPALIPFVFFKYRDNEGRWRLIWCWGYQRKDDLPAEPRFCRTPTCHGLLFAQTVSQPTCYRCSQVATAPPAPPNRTPFNLRRLLVAAALLVAFAVLGWLAYTYWPWTTTGEQLLATPEKETLPVGGRLDFLVQRQVSGKEPIDVRRQSAFHVENPRLLRLDPGTLTATALRPGTTAVRFYNGKLTTQATITVEPMSNPRELILEPERLDLAVSATARLGVVAVAANGTRVRLDPEAVEWSVSHTNRLFCWNGHLQGLDKGEARVRARFRAGPQDPYREATATVNVVRVEWEGLDLTVRPLPIRAGELSELVAEARDSTGRMHSVLGSSDLKLDFDPSAIATIQDRQVRGLQAGKTTLNGRFLGFRSSVPVEVSAGPADSIPDEEPAVTPRELNLVVDEVAELHIRSAPGEDVLLTSSAPEVAEVSGRRVIGRTVGEATVSVGIGTRQVKIPVTVTAQPFESLAIEPEKVSVLVNGTATVRVVGMAGKELRAIAPDRLVWETLPPPRFATFDEKTLTLFGQGATAEAPQTLTVRYGTRTASAVVEVRAAPFRLELTPTGKQTLPLGQSLHLEAWALYADDRRVRVDPDAVEWQGDKVEGLDRVGAQVSATRVGAGPLRLRARHQGQESDAVEIVAGPRGEGPDGEVKLHLGAPRTTLLVGETGRLTLTGATASDPVALAPDGADFTSDNPKTLTVEKASGAFVAVATGKARVTVKHPAAAKSVELELTVVPPDQVRLAFQPDALTLPVGQTGEARLVLLLRDKEGAPERVVPLEATADVRYSKLPATVTWTPPHLTATAATPPFELTATWREQTATLRVEVQDADTKAALRIVPSTARLAPRQQLPLHVQQQTPAGWRAVRPESIRWTTAPGLLWTAPRDGLAPLVGVPDGATGSFDVTAEYGGQSAKLTITAVSPGELLKPGSDGTSVEVEREPPGRLLPVGRVQRYTIWLRNGDRREPAIVQWPADHDNAFVSWKAPVLRAIQAGHRAELLAHLVGGDKRLAVPVVTTTVAEPAGADPLNDAPCREKPVKVRLVSLAGAPLRLPVGGRCGAVRVEATCSAGRVHDVTAWATLVARVEVPPCLAVEGGQFVGIRPGTSTVTAEFKGVVSENTLSAEVTTELDVEKIEVRPARGEGLVGETLTLRAFGVRDGKPAIDITDLAGLTWNAVGNEGVLRVHGPEVGLLKEGAAAILVQAKKGDRALSGSAQITVVADRRKLRDHLAVAPAGVVLLVGESRRLGDEVRVVRGGTDLTRTASVRIANPEILRHDTDANLFVAIAPGRTRVAFTVGEERAELGVEVRVPGTGDDRGKLVLEPAGGSLIVGQEKPLAVYLLTESGKRLNVTASALIESSGPAAVVHGWALRGFEAGKVQVTARVPGIDQPAIGSFEVHKEDISELFVEPESVRLAVGQRKRLYAWGRTASGRVTLYFGRDLPVEHGGANPEAVRVVPARDAGRPAGDIIALAPGKVTLTVRWSKEVSRQVFVEVVEAPLDGLTIAPTKATIDRGEDATFQVFARRGGELVPLNGEDGVTLSSSAPDIGELLSGLRVHGKQSGTSEIAARYGTLRASAWLTVRNPVREQPVTPPRSAGLYFRPEVVRLAVGLPAPPVEVVRVELDGRVVNVSGTVELKGVAAGVAAVTPGPSNLIVEPKSAGRATVTATLANVTTVRPLLIEVHDPAANLAELRVVPEPLEVRIGEATSFGRVEVRPAPGLDPVRVPYKLTTTSDLLKVDGTSLRGVKRGRATVTVGVAVPGKYNGLSVPVEVRVLGNYFEDVKVEKVKDDDTGFVVRVTVTGQAGGDVRYRIVGAAGEGKWVTGEAKGDKTVALWNDLRIDRKPDGSVYELQLQARDGDGPIAPHTLRFQRETTLTPKN